ncbi:MAG: hypothetical protein A3F83_04145 [Candidatus Glassbacteria bacterium RIFCSPLOWO2_12_FULL_58_11]|uniref:Polymerase/histidinol phosphatase N-terminal domain-containing protein n=1 Tax=Candidatus Glassbacteria bacterium RIFCSPLOWO2_12_FULL_58_11 TaxID=1817867 RepID=A0A1F5YT28_9BACT|nr:MAG: hypothetical protein A3F83_04145 [Candidatus Glassbacteria bacterium RIFCSPLOWO2_12_FULL_58_11]
MAGPAYKYDLHVHTTASDGGYGPAEVVHLAAGRGLRAIAVTDHDTTASLSAAAEAGALQDLRVIHGVELTTLDRYHILGYFVQEGEHELSRYLAGLKILSRAHMQGVLSRLRPKGLNVTVEELECRTGEGIPNMSHLLDLMHKNGVLPEIQFDSPSAIEFFGDPDYLVNFFREFARTRPFTDVPGAVRLIREAGGVPVWAHPGQADPAEVERLKGCGLEGLEVTTPKHDSATREYLDRLCRELDLIPTGGTDYHGRMFDSIEKGRQLGTCGVGEHVLDRLRECADRIRERPKPARRESRDAG